jgi:hypothetical protein
MLFLARRRAQPSPDTGSRRRSSPWRSGGTCGSASPIGTSRSCWPRAGSRSTTSRSTGGSNGSRRSSPRPHELDNMHLRTPVMNQGLAGDCGRFVGQHDEDIKTQLVHWSDVGCSAHPERIARTTLSKAPAGMLPGLMNVLRTVLVGNARRYRRSSGTACGGQKLRSPLRPAASAKLAAVRTA